MKAQRPGYLRAVVLSLLVMVVAVPKLSAQVVWAEAGTSTMMRASGLELNYKWAPVQGWIGAGWSDGFNIGGFVQTKIRNSVLGVGDRYQPLQLDTDFFDQNRYFAGRGIFLQKDGESSSLAVFAGATAGEQSTMFYRTFQTEKATGGTFFEKKLSSKWIFHSLNLVQDKITSIQSIHFSPMPKLEFSAAAGVGNSSRFTSVGTRIQRPTWLLTSSYTSAGNAFERVTGVTTNAPERIGTNVRFEYRRFRKVQITLGHENLLSPTLLQNDVPQRISFDSASVSAVAKGFHIGAGASTSSSGIYHAKSLSVGVARNLTARTSTSASWLRIDNGLVPTNILSASVQARMTQRLSLTGGISSQSNHKQFTWGIRWISNRFTFSVQQDMLYTPLAGGFGGKPYTNMWSINLLANVAHGMRLHTDSFVDPAGRMRYTTWVDGIGFSRNGEAIPHAATPGAASIGKYVIMGRVQDVEGKPVWGIAVQVDGQMSFSDNSGRFLVRFRHGQSYPITVLTMSSLNPQYYEVVQSPVSVLAETEDSASDVTIVVRRANAPVRKRAESEPPAQEQKAPVSSALLENQ